eukprot:9579348-Karenia_brevis.AAC.1
MKKNMARKIIKQLQQGATAPHMWEQNNIDNNTVTDIEQQTANINNIQNGDTDIVQHNKAHILQIAHTSPDNS